MLINMNGEKCHEYRIFASLGSGMAFVDMGKTSVSFLVSEVKRMFSPIGSARDLWTKENYFGSNIQEDADELKMTMDGVSGNKANFTSCRGISIDMYSEKEFSFCITTRVTFLKKPKEEMLINKDPLILIGLVPLR